MAENEPKPVSKGWKIAMKVGRIGSVGCLWVIGIGTLFGMAGLGVAVWGLLGLMVFGPVYLVCLGQFCLSQPYGVVKLAVVDSVNPAVAWILVLVLFVLLYAWL